VVSVLTIAMITVVVSFFYLVPYDTIPNKDLFWFAFVGWAVPLVIVVWAVRNKPPRRMNGLLSDTMIVVGIAIISLIVLQNRWDPLHSVTLAAMPGVLSGIMIGVDSWLVLRIAKGQIGRGF
jgi:hypothetical protein